MEGSKKFVIGNWKLNHPKCQDSIKLAESVNEKVEKINLDKDLCVAIAPMNIHLKSVIDNLKGKKSKIVVGAQDCCENDSGAFTGDSR